MDYSKNNLFRPNALIFSPNLDGHRQVYVFVIAHVLNELGYNLFIAGNIDDKNINSFYIDNLKVNRNIKIINTSNNKKSESDFTIEDLIELQNNHKIDLTVFAEADNHIALFNSQLFKRNSKILGRTIGIFLRPFYFYNKLSFLDKLRYLKQLNSKWKSDERLFHGRFLKHFKLLDTALYLDENFVKHHSNSQWLPDVFQQFAETLVKDKNPEQRIWIEKLRDFKKKNENKFILLYFGTSQRRRGYDVLLKMAVEQNTCFIHCGIRDIHEEYDNDIEEFRRILNNNGRLMETDAYISDPLCIECFFKSISYLVLPYFNFYGSSGVMLQALSYGIPVLVPEIGIMGYRVKTHKLGLTYNGDYFSLIEQFNRINELSKDFFTVAITQYMEYQSIVRLKEVLIKAIKG